MQFGLSGGRGQVTVSLWDSLRHPSSQTFIPIFIALLSGVVVIQLSISSLRSFQQEDIASPGVKTVIPFSD